MRTPGDDFDLAHGLPAHRRRHRPPRGRARAIRYCAGATWTARTPTTSSTSTLGRPASPPPDPTSSATSTRPAPAGSAARPASTRIRTQTRWLRRGRRPHRRPDSALSALPDQLRDGAEGLRPHRRPARGRPVHRRRRAAGACARTSAGTTPSTRSSAGRCESDRLPLRGHVLMVVGPGVVRADPEGCDGRASPCWPRFRHRRRWPSTSPTTRA